MLKKTKERLEKWESKTRDKLGTVAFLDKYISVYKLSDRLFKVSFIFLNVMLLFYVIYWSVCFNNTQLASDLSTLGFASISFLLSCFLTVMYFVHVSDSMYGDHIERWKKERAELLENSSESMEE